MLKNVLLYIVAFILLLGVLLFFNSTYRKLSTYSENTTHQNFVYNGFQDLSRQINNAAILRPDLVNATALTNETRLFYTDSLKIIQQLKLLRTSVRDSVNIRIMGGLDAIINSELSWILTSNVPDSIIHQTAPGHTVLFQRIDSLINQGAARTFFLVEDGRKKLNKEITIVKVWMILFIGLSGVLLIYTTFNLFRQQTKTKTKEKELETVLNRISDGVVSIDNDWRYTFLNDAAMATHPFSKEETIGKVIWDVHPEMEGTVFWDKYHEAMRTRKVTEIDNYYAPMDIWFSVKVYPSADGLTIFYKDVTKSKKAEHTLSQTVKEIEDYKFALDEANIVAITDQKGIIKHVNDNFCKISKYTSEELIGQDHRIINSGHHPKEFIRQLWTTIANGKIWKGELKNKAKDGTIYWVDTTIVPFLNEEGKPYQYVAIRADITERKMAEENLGKSLKEIADYKYALDESSIVAITDQKGIIRHVNDNFCKISKYSREELLGKDHRIINSSYHPKEFIRELWVTIANGKIWKGELKNKAKDGTIYWVDTTIIPSLDEKEKPYQYIAIRADITERKKVEEKLIKSEKIYKTIASSIPGSVLCLFDSEYRYLLIEGDMPEKLGYTKEKLMGNKAIDVLSPEAYAGIETDFKRAFSGVTITRESNRNGYDLITRIIPLKDENNAVYAIMTVAIDVTQLKNAHRDISELNRNLEEKVTLRTKELQAANKEMEAFSYSVSHDLRAPLRGIIGFTTILEEEYSDKLDTEGRRIASVIKNNTMKMGRLIDDLLAFSRMGRQDIQKTNIDTNKMIKEVINELSTMKNLKIEWTISPLPAIKGDINTIRQVWVNLISNAIKYSGNKENQCIQIGGYSEAGQLVFFVKDNGVGFDEQYKNKLFKVFQRLHGAEEFEGTGVGLALVEKIVSKHGGKVWAESEVKKGATFYFNLPE